ncbi:MAG: hypothetical protein LBC80_05735 [Treponema sp.]|jgi:hypothetical protein|nr:hypothetical protein [Treponema sp.]
MKKTQVFFLFLVVLIFNSCIGLAINIQMNNDGSGRLTLEYRVSRILMNIGGLDGNQRWPVIPVGRADWDRTIERINGARINSFSTKEVGLDTVITVVINYDTPQTLLEMLEPLGDKASITTDNAQWQLLYILEKGAFDAEQTGIEPDLMELAQTMFSDYDLSISFSAPGNSTMAITDGDGNEITPPDFAGIISSGRTTSMKMRIMDVIGMSDGIGVLFRW